MNEPGAMFSDGKAYERFMGRWSRVVGEQFLDWLDPPKGLRWIDVGCGNGAFTEVLISRTAPAAVTGIDPSDGQIAYARTRPGTKLAEFHIGDSQSLPFPDDSFDAASMALVISFIPDPVKAASEMARVVKPGGWVATYMWDVMAGGMPIEPIYTALRSIGVDPPRPPGSVNASRDNMRAVWERAGLKSLDMRVIRIPIVFSDLDDFLASTSLPVGPTASALANLSPDARKQYEARLREQLPIGADGRITYEAFANAAKGRVPG